MRYRILDADGDYQLGKGQQYFTYGVYAVAQAIKTRLLLLKGEWWENTEEGLPLFQEILGKQGTSDNLYITDTLIKERIIGTPNVIDIIDFNSEFNSQKRRYAFNCTVNTRFGELYLKNQTL